jgi:hypothetical protein
VVARAHWERVWRKSTGSKNSALVNRRPHTLHQGRGPLNTFPFAFTHLLAHHTPRTCRISHHRQPSCSWHSLTLHNQHLRSLAPTKRTLFAVFPVCSSDSTSLGRHDLVRPSVALGTHLLPKPHFTSISTSPVLHHLLRSHCSRARISDHPKTHSLSSTSSIRQSAPLSLTAIAAAVIAPAINSLPTSTHFLHSPHRA